MATQSSPHNPEDDPLGDSQYYLHDDSDPSLHHDTPMKDADLKPVKEPLPLQKRRRVTRACDECRRKKIKCDGKQPCTHCTVYSYECTFDQPSNRRRNPAPQYVEALETRLHKAEALLRVVFPDINLDDPQFDVHATEQMLAKKEKEKQNQNQNQNQNASPDLRRSSNAGAAPQENGEGGDESLLETMVDNSGYLDMDDQGHWDYHGHTSGVIFIQRLRKQLGAEQFPSVGLKTRPISQMLESPKSVSDSPQDTSLPPTHDLPSRAVAQRLCHNALDDACSLMRFVHEPSFFAMLDRIYDTPPEQFNNEENSFLPLLYIVMSVGCLFSDDGAGTLDVSGYESAIGQGFQFFKAGRNLLEITDCRDLPSLQAICFMVLFLQSSAKLSTCYSYVGIALRSALRLGLHRSVAADFNPIERELRKRIFWVVRKMDVYVSTLLGLPLMLSDDDIDQEYPLAIDGDFITADGIMPMPSDRTPLMAGPNAHTRLANIIGKVVKYIYPVKHAQYRSKSDQRYMVSHSKIREIERDLQTWMEELPAALRPGTEVSPQLERIRQLLRISYAHVQMVMYRPFLHYVSSGSQARGVDKRSYACAAACVSVSRNIVHITTGMHKRGLLNGSFWFTMYTTYFAILSLIFFVLENPDSPTAKDGVLKDAMEGKNTLAGLAKKSMAADRCSQSLNALFKNLPELLKNRQSSAAPVNLKRSAPSAAPSAVQSNKPVNPKASQRSPEQTPQRSNTFPIHLLSRPTKEASNAPKSLDDNNTSRKHHNRNQSHGTISSGSMNNSPAWMASTPELQTGSASTPSDGLTADRINLSPANTSLPSSLPQDQSTLAFSQSFANLGNFPDLMPIMFPSDDPFAYPTQPMSTLEDDHFRNDGTQFPFDQLQRAMPTTKSSTPGMSGVTTPHDLTPQDFAHLPGFLNGLQTGMATMPNRLPQGQHMNRSSRLQSPVSHGSTPGNEHVNSPDLVSIPNQNFLWQSYNFQPQDASLDQTMNQQQVPPVNGSQNFDMNMDHNMGMGIDLGIPLDDLFGNGDMRGSTGNFSNDEWTQWMNVGG